MPAPLNALLVFCGEVSGAASAVAETQSVEEATGIGSAPYGALILQAWRGKPRETRELIGTTIRDASSRGEGLESPSVNTRARFCATAHGLFLSPRTVEWHLHKVFTKIGIRSRRELAKVQLDSASELVAA